MYDGKFGLRWQALYACYLLLLEKKYLCAVCRSQAKKQENIINLTFNELPASPKLFVLRKCKIITESDRAGCRL